jgi:hypothetical protein
LDFKQEFTKDDSELAKDIAAMTVNGGVVFYGVAEAKRTAMAVEVTPIEMAGVETKLRQAIGSHVNPVPTSGSVSGTGRSLARLRGGRVLLGLGARAQAEGECTQVGV